jgi:miniconductance mechanosensitive channel
MGGISLDFIRNQLLKFDMNLTLVGYLSVIIMLLFITITCVVANFISKKVVIRIITKIVKKSKNKWDNMLLEREVFHRISHIVPAIIIYLSAPAFPTYQNVIEKGAMTYVIIMGLIVINSILNAMNDIYRTFEISKDRPIKGYIQVGKIIFITIGVILTIANLLDKSPFLLLSGIGALSAVLLLVFKDSLLGLVAGVQLTTNNMVRVGDWIEVPKYGADGDVIDISLNTVKVQNFDKTITSFPSYALISDSFKNWRGMQTSGGRRIKRSLLVDINCISFCTEEMINNFKSIHYLSDYLVNKELEIAEYNTQNKINKTNPVNGRALTNIGVFRAYISNYLQNHPGISKDMTLMVRPLAPSENGLPIEIYAFTNTVIWTVYETIQADIFDHLFAVAPEFGIQLFQNPSGNDLKSLRMNQEEI